MANFFLFFSFFSPPHSKLTTITRDRRNRDGERIEIIQTDILWLINEKEMEIFELEEFSLFVNNFKVFQNERIGKRNNIRT